MCPYVPSLSLLWRRGWPKTSNVSCQNFLIHSFSRNSVAKSGRNPLWRLLIRTFRIRTFRIFVSIIYLATGAWRTFQRHTACVFAATVGSVVQRRLMHRRQDHYHAKVGKNVGKREERGRSQIRGGKCVRTQCFTLNWNIMRRWETDQGPVFIILEFKTFCISS